jgi:DNA-binding transcriptional regulator YiaG
MATKHVDVMDELLASMHEAREWEQGRRHPEASARVLLLVIASKPEIVDEVLAAAAPRAA